LNEVLRLQPEHANAHYLKGYIHQRENALDQAFDEFQAALRFGTD
jgi:hypothetical protein